MASGEGSGHKKLPNKPWPLIIWLNLKRFSFVLCVFVFIKYNNNKNKNIRYLLASKILWYICWYLLRQFFHFLFQWYFFEKKDGFVINLSGNSITQTRKNILIGVWIYNLFTLFSFFSLIFTAFIFFLVDQLTLSISYKKIAWI